MKSIIKRIITDFIEKELPEVKSRDISLPVDSGKIITVVGARRTGKTFILYGTINKLREKISRNRIVYINFEDDRLFPASLKTMDNFLEAYYELYPENLNHKVFFFFDEVQVIEKWELFIRRLYDNQNCSIFITGSSSKLLIKDISTALRGRSISFEIFPLGFNEYLQFKDVDINMHSTKSKSRIVKLFGEYLYSSSFPELIDMEESLRRKSLKEYLDLIIYKDIVEKYGVSNIHLMKYLVKFLFSNSANLISINKIYNEMKSSGLNISRNSVYEYISYLEDSYTVFSLPLYTRNLGERRRNPNKYYALDTGLRMAMTLAEDSGKLLESVVYMHLRRQNENIFYYLTDKETDFIMEKGKEPLLINVCYDLTPTGTKAREISSLVNAMKELNVSGSYLLTSDEEGEEIINRKKIRIVPVWKWTLGIS